MIVDLTLAPLAVLAFLGTVLFAVAMVAAMALARFSGKAALAGLMLKALAGGVGLYFVVLLCVSAFSKDYVLRQGAEKHFCEIDCHLAYSVTKIERVNAVPAEFTLRPTFPAGQLYVVTLRTRFDETTIGPDRGNAPLTPNQRAIEIRDDANGKYQPATVIAGTRLTQALRPGESYETRILVSAPKDARGLKMWLRDDDWPDSFLIGHENSPLHGKAYFDLND